MACRILGLVTFFPFQLTVKKSFEESLLASFPTWLTFHNCEGYDVQSVTSPTQISSSPARGATSSYRRGSEGRVTAL
jgi:hypothetical protein